MFKIFCAYLQIDKIVIVCICFELSYNVAIKFVLLVVKKHKKHCAELKHLKNYVALVNTYSKFLKIR